MKTTDIRILVVEDHFLARFALAKFLDEQTDMSVVAIAETGAQAVALYSQHRPDVVLMDLRMPEMDGVTAIHAIRKIDARAHVLVVSHYETTDEVRQALAAGALGFVKKDASAETLLEAIRRTASGRGFVPPSMAETLSTLNPADVLRAREREVLQHMFHGESNQEIADALGISESTVRIHVSNIFHKLGVSRRTEAISAALKQGLIRFD